MNPIGISILLLLIFVVLIVPRRWALMGMMAGVLYLTQVQQVDVLGFNLYAIRFLELAGFIRVISRKEFSFSRLNKIDRTLLFFYCYVAIVYSLRSTEGQINVIGLSVDAFLCYFTFRGLIVDLEDFRWFLKSFFILLAPYAALVLIESLTQHNMFSFIGGGIGGWQRGDRFRAVGTFRNPDLLGALGASFLPLYIGMACIKIERKLACLGISLCLMIVWASNSGGPIGATGMGLVGWALWRERTKMRRVRQWLVGGLVLLALVMKAPVWYLLDRVSSLTGGDGYNRAYLIDVSFQNFGKWWFAGMPITDTVNWFPYSHPLTGGADITNQFISFGLMAGVGAIVLLIVLLLRAFSSLGKALEAVRANSKKPNESEFLLWGLGVLVAIHIITWFGITYYDQFYVVWFMQLAAISSVSTSCIKAVLAERNGAMEELRDDTGYLGPQMHFKTNLP
jgi:hypothetical protein